MSTNISANVLRNFISKTIGGDKIAVDRAGKFDIDRDKAEEINENDNNYIEIDEILDDNELYEKFATMFVEEEKEAKNEKDSEKEKEEKYKVKDKNGAGAA